MINPSSPRILVMNQPRAYRETVAMALGMLCQHVDVLTVEPENAETSLIAHRPHMVVCSEVTPEIKRLATSWISIYPDGESTAVHCTGGQCSTVPNIDLMTLARFVDELAPPPMEMHQ